MTDLQPKIKPSDKPWSTDPAGAAKLRMGKEGITARQPMSIPQVLTKTATEFPNHTAMAFKDINKTWQTITYG